MDWWEKPGECVVQEAQGKQCVQKGRERSTESEAAKMSGFAGFTQKLTADTSMGVGWAGRLLWVRIEWGVRKTRQHGADHHFRKGRDRRAQSWRGTWEGGGYL